MLTNIKKILLGTLFLSIGCFCFFSPVLGQEDMDSGLVDQAMAELSLQQDRYLQEIQNRNIKVQASPFWYLMDEFWHRMGVFFTFNSGRKIQKTIRHAENKLLESAMVIKQAKGGEDFSPEEGAPAVQNIDLLERGLGYYIFYLEKASARIEHAGLAGSGAVLADAELLDEVLNHLMFQDGLIRYLRQNIPGGSISIVNTTCNYAYENLGKMMHVLFPDAGEERAFESLSRTVEASWGGLKVMEALEQMALYLPEEQMADGLKNRFIGDILKHTEESADPNLFYLYYSLMPGHELTHFSLLNILSSRCRASWCQDFYPVWDELKDQKMTAFLKSLEAWEEGGPELEHTAMFFSKGDPVFRLRIFELVSDYLDANQKKKMRVISDALADKVQVLLKHSAESADGEYPGYSVNDIFDAWMLSKQAEELGQGAGDKVLGRIVNDLGLLYQKYQDESSGGDWVLEAAAVAEPKLLKFAYDFQDMGGAQNLGNFFDKINGRAMGKLSARIHGAESVRILRVLEKNINQDKFIQNMALDVMPDLNQVIEQRKMAIDQEVKKKIERIKNDDIEREKDLRRLLKHKKYLMELMRKQQEAP